MSHAAVADKHINVEGLCLDSQISAIDLFCGAGGLTHGLMKAGIKVEAGIDFDGNAKHAYETNNHGARFLEWDVTEKHSPSIEALFSPKKIRLLAGCAPCTPFSKLTNGMEKHHAFDLLDNFGKFVKGIIPDLVTMENVPELSERGKPVFDRFRQTLESLGFNVDWKLVDCQEYGIPQSRRRLVLLGSRFGKIEVPAGRYARRSQWKTVEQTIGNLPALESGESDPLDQLHGASKLSPINLQRIRATKPNGGTWKDWPKHLLLKCHQRESGKTYRSIYGRMWWDQPAPTMTTLCTGLGNGRFGHPEQHRSITLREAALFQSFPKSYEFWPAGKRPNRSAISRMVGNAVPPKLARILGETLIEHVRLHAPKR
ncbi:MAG: DNA cytosine methyltransferase [Nitrosospira sp.]|nr:DNA cytosine methyltransferase [Nitrosospira sp.]